MTIIKKILKTLPLGLLLFITQLNTVNAQPLQYTRPSWWFGFAGAANFNFYEGSTQSLNSNLRVPAVFNKGFGVGLFLAPLIEYYKPNTRLGVMLQLGFDGKNGKFDEILTPCNCPADLKTNLSYYTIEPSLRFAPFKNGLYLYAGPRFSFNAMHSFTFLQKPNPAYPAQVASPEVTGEMDNINSTLISAQVGLGYDIQLSSTLKHTQFVFSPFVAFQPYYGQDPRSIETWNITSLRVGAALKMGRGHVFVGEDAKKKEKVVEKPPIVIAPIIASSVVFKVKAPSIITNKRTVREVFPLRNYVFFDLGSNEIPSRYKLIKKDEVKEFKEDQVKLNTPSNFSGRSERQMLVYYNILNILGDRMGKNPNTTITLVGSSENGVADAETMAGNIKKYLVEVFGISESRIAIEGRLKPKIPSQHPGKVNDLDLLKQGDRRVSIESSSPVLLMEFQSGPIAPLKPLEVVVVQEAPIESMVKFEAKGASKAYSNWSLEITDDKNMVQNYGPYTTDLINLPGKTILGDKTEGTYKIAMIGTTKNGSIEQKDTTVHLVLWNPSSTSEVTRFSVIYEYDESKAIGIYEKYLSEVVIPKIPIGATVIIHGYTDIIGDAEYNQILSTERANDVQSILQKALAKLGRTDVKFDVFGFGEDNNLSPFENKYPEERFYNRTVVIDIVPKI